MNHVEAQANRAVSRVSSAALRAVADEVIAGTGPAAVARYIRQLSDQPRLPAEALALDREVPAALDADARAWAALRDNRSSADDPAFHGQAGPQPAPSSYDAEAAPEDEGLAGAKMGITDNNTTGRFTKQTFALDGGALDGERDPVEAAKALADKGGRCCGRALRRCAHVRVVEFLDRVELVGAGLHAQAGRVLDELRRLVAAGRVVFRFDAGQVGLHRHAGGNL